MKKKVVYESEDGAFQGTKAEVKAYEIREQFISHYDERQDDLLFGDDSPVTGHDLAEWIINNKEEVSELLKATSRTK